MKNVQKKIYYYTEVSRLSSILKAQELRLMSPISGLPHLLCSTDQILEKAAYDFCDDNYKPIPLETIRDTINSRVGLLRIQVAKEQAPYNWKQFIQICGVKKEEAKSMERGALKMGLDTSAWRFSIKPIPSEFFYSLENQCCEYSGWCDISVLLNYSWPYLNEIITRPEKIGITF